MHTVDILILTAFVAYAIIVGLRSRKAASRNLEEYFLAGRTLKGWQAGVSMAATQFSADTPMLVVGMIATAGIFSVWRLWIFAIAFLVMGFLLASCWRRAGVLTDAELTEIRYANKPAAFLRGLKAVYLGTVFNCTVLAMVLKGTVAVAEPFLLWDQWLPAFIYTPFYTLVTKLGVVLTLHTNEVSAWIQSTNNVISIFAIAAVTTFYSATGGLRSVVATDLVQFCIMMLATVLLAVFVVEHAGGLAAIPDQIRTLFADGGPGGITPDQILAFTPSQAKDVTLMVILMLGVQWLAQINSDGTGYLAQRAMACRSDTDAKQAAVIFTVLQVLLRSLLWLPIGLGLLIVFPPDLGMAPELLKAEREATFVRGMVELLPAGAIGLALTAMLAALASTIDTHLNWGASYWTNDIYKRFVCNAWLKKEPGQRSLVWFARASNVAILILSILIMSQLASIQEAWYASLLIGAGLGAMLVLRWIWWRINAWGEIACIVTSFVTLPYFLSQFAPEQDALRLLLSAALSTGVGITASFIVGPEPLEKLQTFYQRVQPPGFWGPVARSLGRADDRDRRELFVRTGAVFSTALSVFSLLTGFGSWLADSPPPTWFPYQGVWIAALIALGIGLIPVCWRLGFRDRTPPAAAQLETL